MNMNTAKKLIEKLIKEVSTEINNIKAQVVGEIIIQVAIYSHDHIGAHRMTFGELSNRPSLDNEHLKELDKIRAVLLDREQRKNALKHLMCLIEEGNEKALQLLQKELQSFFSEGEIYEFFLAPEAEYPNEYVKPYPYAE